MKRTLQLLMLDILLFGLLCQAAQKTVVVYVNGINTTLTKARDTRSSLQTNWNTYALSKGIPIANNPTFDLSYNQHTWWLGDLTEATRQLVGQYGTDLTKYYYDQSLIASANDNDLRQLAATESNTPGSQFNATMLALDNTKSSTPASLYNPLNDAINRMSQPDYTDLTNLVAKLKDYITTGNKTVCLGHSQGNFYCNLAYQVIQRDYAGTKYALPNDNVLEVISVATPSSYTADGRFQYVKYCRDISNAFPFSLDANYKNPAELAPCMPRSTSFTSNLASSVAGLISFIINGAGWKEHDMDNSYLAAGSNLLNLVMMQIENSLPDPGCGGDASCYLKDNFQAADYIANWMLTKSGGTVSLIGGVLYLDTSGGELTLRTRRVFTGPFTASFQFNSLGSGNGFLRIKKAADDTTVLNQGIAVTGWHTATITKTDTQLSLSVDE